MAQKNRELSQFGSFLLVDNLNQNIGIATTEAPSIGIGTTNPTKKFHVVGDTLIDGQFSTNGEISIIGNSNISGFVSATAYYLNGNPLVDAAVELWTNESGSDIYRLNGNVGIGTTDPGFTLDVSGDINLSGNLYQDGVPFVGSKWSDGSGSDIYRLDGNVGIGTSTLTQRLTVSGNVSAGQFISTALTGVAPFSVQSETVVTNLNAFYLRDGVPGRDLNSGDIITRDGTQTLTNKTLTSPIITSIQVGSGNNQTLPSGTGSIISTNSVGLVTSGMIANNTIINEDISTGAGITYGKLSLSNSILNSDISTGAGITYGKLSLSNSIVGNDIVNSTISNAKLQNSTISGVSLGNNLGTLTFGTYLQKTGTSYNGSGSVTLDISASSLNNANEIVVRDSSGNFSAGTITANNVTITSAVIGLGVTINSSGINATSGIITASSIRDTSGNVRAIPQNSQSATYTLALTDVGKHVNITAGVGVTVPPNIFSAGDAISIFNNTGTAKTISAGGGVTLRLAGTSLSGTRYLSQYALGTIICVASNVFAISGAGVT